MSRIFPVVVMNEPPQLQKLPALIEALIKAYGAGLEIVTDEEENYSREALLFGFIPEDEE